MLNRTISLQEMGRRYTHAEREGISCGTLGRGDITGWAKPTSSFKRPEVQGRPPISNPCKPLHEYGLLAIASPHKPEEVFFPADSKPHPGLDMGRAQIISEVNERLHNHFVASKQATGKPLEMPKPQLVSEIAKCKPAKAIQTETTNWLGQKIIVVKDGKNCEREPDVELHSEQPLPYDRPCKANNWRR